MNLKNSLKKIVCFLLAVMMIFAVAGCKKESSGGKKKVIIKKKVIKTNNSEVLEETDSYYEEEEEEKQAPTRQKRKLFEKEVKEKYVEKYTPEFTSEYVNWAGPSGYAIVYSPETPLNRVSAENLQKYFMEQYEITAEDIPIVKDTEVAATAKEILVGNTNRYTTKLAENKFAVILKEEKLIFEGGHKLMVEKAADWFISVEKKDGKVAVLNGTAEDFKAKMTVNGKEYELVWADECDGTGGLDHSRWKETNQKNFYGDITWLTNDINFNRYEGGRLKMVADRYYDETNAANEYATGGVLSTQDNFVFRRGYMELRARIPYMKGAFPAWWTRSYTHSKIIPTDNLTQTDYWFEIDMLEAFSATNSSFANTIHKWYRSVDKTNKKVFDFQGNDITNQIELSNEATESEIAAGINLSDPGHSVWQNFDEVVGSDEKRWYRFDVDYEELNKQYHTYTFLWEADHLWFGVDGEWYSDYAIDCAFDGYSGNNNNGYGFDVFNYLLLDNHIYSPMAYESGAVSASSVINNADLPVEMYVDYVRLYQDPTDNALHKDNYAMSSIINSNDQE